MQKISEGVERYIIQDGLECEIETGNCQYFISSYI